MCHRSPILAILPLTRSLQDLRKRVFRNIITDRQTEGHRDSMTESTQLAYSVRRQSNLTLGSGYK